MEMYFNKYLDLSEEADLAISLIYII